MLVTLPLCLGLVFAQGPRFHGDGSSGTPPTPQQMAQNQTSRLTRFFNLTSTQQQAVLGILTTADTQTSTLRTQIQPLRANLVAAVKANNSAQITAALEALAPLQQQIASIDANAAGQIYATVLTSAQQTQIQYGLGPLMGFGGRF